MTAGAAYTDGLVVSVDGVVLNREPIFQSGPADRAYGLYVPLDANASAWSVTLSYVRSAATLAAQVADPTAAMVTIHVRPPPPPPPPDPRPRWRRAPRR